MKLSVVVLNYNVSYFLDLCLDSVQKSLTDIESEIIVVDNNSSDNSIELVKTKYPDVKLYESKENTGFSKGNNLGVELAQGEYICILNPDTIVPEDVFKKLLFFYESIDNIGAVGVKLIDGAGMFLPESKRNLPLPQIALEKLLGKSDNYYVNSLNEDEVGKSDVLVGAFMFLKSSIYKEVNGFDEDFFMYGEDIDLSYRIKKQGYQNFYFGEAKVIHFKGESSIKDRVYAKRFYNAMLVFYKKHFSVNIFLDFLIQIIIKLLPLISKTIKSKSLQISRKIIFSLKPAEEIERILKLNNKSFKVISDIRYLLSVNVNTEIIYDSSSFAYSEIIESMSKILNKDKISVKFIETNGEFILGSSSNKSQGEITLLK